MKETQEFDIEEAKARAKEQYEEETGETLPDHVLENYDILNAAGPSFDDLVDFRANHHKVYRGGETSLSKRDLSIVWAAIAIGMGALGFGAGLGLASNLGVAVVGLVALAFGFAVATLLN